MSVISGPISVPSTTAAVDTLYPPSRRIFYLLIAVAIGITIAGFWNFRVVDGFGADIVAANTIGDYRGKAGQFASLGTAFGFIFAFVAGLAATFTACNCVAFAMIPGLVCSQSDGSGRTMALRSLGVMLAWVVIVSVVYGSFIGWLGPAGVAAINARDVRFAQATTVFSVLGVAMLIWGAIDLGLANRLVARCTPASRAFFSQQTTRAALMGMMIGAFAIGRPYPVFREFLLYAAQAKNPVYGAAVMALQGIGQVTVMVAAFLAVIVIFRRTLVVWAQKTAQTALVSALALVAGGAYFLFYWGIARAWPSLGRWGFQLGWYS
jgi:cytochrome c biogenesis protein CcdA